MTTLSQKILRSRRAYPTFYLAIIFSTGIGPDHFGISVNGCCYCHRHSLLPEPVSQKRKQKTPRQTTTGREIEQKETKSTQTDNNSSEIELKEQKPLTKEQFIDKFKTNFAPLFKNDQELEAIIQPELEEIIRKVFPSSIFTSVENADVLKGLAKLCEIKDSKKINSEMLLKSAFVLFELIKLVQPNEDSDKYMPLLFERLISWYDNVIKNYASEVNCDTYCRAIIVKFAFSSCDENQNARVELRNKATALIEPMIKKCDEKKAEDYTNVSLAFSAIYGCTEDPTEKKKLIQQAIDFCNNIFKKNGTDVDLTMYHFASVHYYSLSQLEENTTEQKKHLKQAMELSEQGIDISKEKSEYELYENYGNICNSLVKLAENSQEKQEFLSKAATAFEKMITLSGPQHDFMMDGVLADIYLALSDMTGEKKDLLQKSVNSFKNADKLFTAALSKVKVMEREIEQGRTNIIDYFLSLYVPKLIKSYRAFLELSTAINKPETSQELLDQAYLMHESVISTSKQYNIEIDPVIYKNTAQILTMLSALAKEEEKQNLLNKAKEYEIMFLRCFPRF